MEDDELECEGLRGNWRGVVLVLLILAAFDIDRKIIKEFLEKNAGADKRDDDQGE